jgi:hypothetical protein
MRNVPASRATSDQRSPPTSSRRSLFRTEHVGDELEIPDDLPAELEELVKRELRPLINPREDRLRIAPTRLAAGGSSNGNYLPLLLDLDRYALAALYRPPGRSVEYLFLPENISDIAPWLLYMFKRWAEALPDVFPSQPEWTSNPMWMTAEELSALSNVAERRADEERVVAEQRALVAVAEASLETTRESVDASERQLLTAGDTPLVDIVHQTLEMFGFEVTNVDDGLAEGQAKKEDLRVADGGWLAICEVKGYSKGGKLVDLQKLNGFATLYAVETGSAPSAMWFVVNQFRGTDPSSRPQLLQGADEYLQVFAHQGGLAIDTRDLFRIRKALASNARREDECQASRPQAARRISAQCRFQPTIRRDIYAAQVRLRQRCRCQQTTTNAKDVVRAVTSTCKPWRAGTSRFAQECAEPVEY